MAQLPGVAKAVQFSRAGSDNFGMASRNEGASVSFQFAAFPRNSFSSPPLYLPTHIRGGSERDSAFPPLALRTRREWSPLRRLAHSLRDPCLCGSVSPGAAGVKVGASAPHPPG